MITIVNKYTGELVCKYSNASKQYADKDSFIANVKGSKAFRRRSEPLFLTSITLLEQFNAH